MKNDFSLSLGAEVLYQGNLHIIKAYLSLTTFLLIDKVTGLEIVADLNAIAPIKDEASNVTLIENGIVRLSHDAWQEAERRASLIRPLAAMTIVPAVIANEVAAILGVSSRTVYTLIQRFRESGGLLTSMASTVSSGGRGKSRLPSIVEQIITATIAEMYLSKQKRSAEDVAQEVRRRCVHAKLVPPSFNTVRNRIRSLNKKDTMKQREGRKQCHQEVGRSRRQFSCG